MLKHLLKKSTLELNFETEGLSPQQLRLIKTLNYALVDLLRAENEDKFFDKSSELMKLAADAIRLSQFSDGLKTAKDQIPYAKQAIEFSIDNISESFESRGARLDN